MITANLHVVVMYVVMEHVVVVYAIIQMLILITVETVEFSVQVEHNVLMAHVHENKQRVIYANTLAEYI